MLHMADKYSLPRLNPSYYLEAMSAFQVRLKAKKGKVIFVIVSDDWQWVKSNLIPRVKRFNAYLGGTGVTNYTDDLATDLGILARCNHTVLSYGTFSFWGGFLSGGKRILPYMIFNEKIKDLDKDLNSPFMLPDQGIITKEPWQEYSNTIRI